MLDELRRVLEGNPDIAYALLFGSGARGALSPTSDVDVAVELRRGAPHDTAALGQLAARLESATGRRVDLERDHAALVARKAQAILQYLDFKPVEELCAEGVLRAAARRG